MNYGLFRAGLTLFRMELTSFATNYGLFRRQLTPADINYCLFIAWLTFFRVKLTSLAMDLGLFRTPLTWVTAGISGWKCRFWLFEGGLGRLAGVMGRWVIGLAPLFVVKGGCKGMDCREVMKPAWAVVLGGQGDNSFWLLAARLVRVCVAFRRKFVWQENNYWSFNILLILLLWNHKRY